MDMRLIFLNTCGDQTVVRIPIAHGDASCAQALEADVSVGVPRKATGAMHVPYQN